MPRIGRGYSADNPCHILNRGNGGAVVFHKDADYAAFLDLLAKAKSKYPVKIFGFCLMPNHFHLVLQSRSGDSLGPFMQWWMTSHVRRYHRHYGGYGHVWQGRFKSFPIQQDEHFLTVLRYVLRNPVRAGLTERPIQWPWSSLHHPHLIESGPVQLPADWESWVEKPLFDHELTAVRTSVSRQAPFGSAAWREDFAADFALQSTLRPRGRPRRSAKK